MIIKKHKSKNKYIVTPNCNVRDFTTEDAPALDLNHLVSDTDRALFIENEFANLSHRYPFVENEQFIHRKVIIISDGYDFQKTHQLLAVVPKDVAIIAVNGALKKWKLVGTNAEYKRAINYYVVNNPFQECMNYLPVEHAYYPRCIASSKTNSEFLKEYLGLKYLYIPTEDEKHTSLASKAMKSIDDYRNPVCAALGLAYRFKANKILLLCCDTSFADGRPGAEALSNGLWQYPQQRTSHDIIDAYCYWLAAKKITVRNCSSGPNYKSAAYIHPDTIVDELLNNDQ